MSSIAKNNMMPESSQAQAPPGGSSAPSPGSVAAAENAATRAAIAREFSHLPAYFLNDAKGIKRLHDLIVDRAQRADRVAHASADATLHRLGELDKALACVLNEDNLLFDGVTASGRDILEALRKE